MIDAERFFGNCSSFWIWPQLTSLTLTSTLLLPPNQAATNNLLQKIAGIAMRMPKLETIQIWNGGKRLAALFQYQLRSRKAKITWRATWDFSLEASVIKAWEAVAECHDTKPLVCYEKIDKRMIGNLGDAIHHLGHAERILRPVSLHQLRLEGPHRPKRC